MISENLAARVARPLQWGGTKEIIMPICFRWLCALVAMLAPRLLYAESYTLRPTTVHQSPSAAAHVVTQLFANETVLLQKAAAPSGWQAVRVGRLQGFVRTEALSDLRVVIYKQERELLVMKNDDVLARYPVALGAQAPRGDKRRQGDRATPEGRFFVAHADAAPEATRYGARSLLLSYPSVRHARDGFGRGVISRDQYERMVKSLRVGETPSQTTPLGGSIRIHGGGADHDWTLGCIALADEDVKAVFARLGQGSRVDVFASRAVAKLASEIPQRVAQAAQAQLQTPAFYSRHAMGAPRLPYPLGDIDKGHAVCSDIVIRALRSANLDLQSLVWEDRLLRNSAYHDARARNWSIDHRRVRNLVTFFERWAEPVPGHRPHDFEAGDIVVFDVGVNNGIPFDHVGVVGPASADNPYPLVVNIWAPGATTSPMALLGQTYPTVVAHYRLSSRLWQW